MQEMIKAGYPAFNHEDLCESMFHILINDSVTLNVADIIHSPDGNYLSFSLSFQNRMMFALQSIKWSYLVEGDKARFKSWSFDVPQPILPPLSQACVQINFQIIAKTKVQTALKNDVMQHLKNVRHVPQAV